VVDRDYSHSIMASWYNNVVYDGRIYTYSSGTCNNCNFDKGDKGQKSILTDSSYVKFKICPGNIGHASDPQSICLANKMLL
jgi:hypothetical protein